MSTFSQFVGSQPPFGQPLTMIDTRANPTVNGIEYLRAGVLKSASGYSNFVSNWPSFSYNLPSGSAYFLPTSTATINLLFAGTRYYLLRYISGETKIPFTTGLTSDFSNFGSVITATSAISLDSCRVGSSDIIISVDGGDTGNGNFYINGITATNFSTTVANYVCASNTAGTLSIVVSSLVNNSPSYLSTSANGTSWTARTISGGDSLPVYRATWCPVGNCFIYITWNSRKIWTTPDGYTLTDRGKPDGISTGGGWSASYAALNNHYCASSSSSTLISMQDNTNTSWIIKTTNGTSFTATKAQDLFGNLVRNPISPKLYYLNNAYYALFTNNGNYAYPDHAILKSTDEGVTWNFVPLPFIPGFAYGSNGWPYRLSHLTVLNNNIVAIVVNVSSLDCRYAVLSSYDTATHIGRVAAPTVSIGSNPVEYPNIYYRIK